jgi:RimJ/RimL family protein N-acetyltransferase
LTDSHTDAAGSDDLGVPILTTERLTIRPLRLDDLDACHQLNRDVGWTDAALSDAENHARRATWLDWTLASYRELERLHQPPIGERAVVERSTGRFVGMVGLVPCLAPFDQLPSRGAKEHARATAELGLFWAISPSRQKLGLASEAAAALIGHVFKVRRVARVIATTDYDNAASIGVMRRLGMTIERNPFADPFYLQVVGRLNAEDWT